MPKKNDRERLAKIEADQFILAEEAKAVRTSLRAQYGVLVADLAVERLSERDFKDLITQAIRLGGTASVAALKALETPPTSAKVTKTPRPGSMRNAPGHQAGPAPSEAIASATSPPD